MPSRHRPALLLALVLVAACSRGGSGDGDSAAGRSPGESAREIAVAIDRAVPKLERKEWKSAAGGTSATVSAFGEGGKVRLIRERRDHGARGIVSARYYFADGKLRYYESEGDVLDADPPGASPVRRKEKVVMAFDMLGTLLDGSRLLDDQRSILGDARVQAVLARSQELQREETTAGSPPGKP